MMSTTAVPAGSTRTWESYSGRPRERGNRIMVGIHFRKAFDDGETQGRAVGDRVVDNYFGEVDE